MITCHACQKLSSLDSRFCRGCGVALEADAISAALDEHQELIHEGARMLADQRHAEALLIAEKAVEENPASAEAYALLGDCYERSGDLRGALDAYDKVVELNPSSPLDRIKLAHLRDLFAERTTASPKRNSRALLLAGAAVIMVGCFGAAAAIFTRPNEKTVTIPQEDPNEGAPLYAMNQPTAPTRPLDNGSQGRDATSDVPVAEPVTRPARPNTGSELPSAGGGSAGIATEGPIGPLRVRPDGMTGNPPAAKPNTGDPEPAQVKPTTNPSPGGNTGSTSKPPRPPVYEITTSSQGNPTHGAGSTPMNADNPNDASNMVRVARQSFAAGNYERAADAYEKALRLGAEPANTNQRLAQCYERLGRKADAINAYRDAISAFEQRLAKGKGDAGANQAGLDACRQAIRTLGG